MTLREDLEAVAALLEGEGRWIQGASARAADGLNVYPLSDNACGWCLTGAIERVAEGNYLRQCALMEHLCDVLALTRWQPRVVHLIAFNDRPGRTQAEVVALVRKAAEAAS